MASALASPTQTFVHQPVVDDLPPSTVVLGSGVYMGGQGPMRMKTSLLQAGGRYLLARDGGDLRILGPVHVDATKIVARIPVEECEVSLDDGRLLVQGRTPNIGLNLTFSAISIARDLDLSAAMAVNGQRAGEAP